MDKKPGYWKTDSPLLVTVAAFGHPDKLMLLENFHLHSWCICLQQRKERAHFSLPIKLGSCPSQTALVC